MALQACGLNLGRGLKELQPHGSLEFPCAGYASRYMERQEDIIPWHWHEEMEIVYVESGQMEVKIPSKFFCWKKGIVWLSIPMSFILVQRWLNVNCVFSFSARH